MQKLFSALFLAGALLGSSAIVGSMSALANPVISVAASDGRFGMRTCISSAQKGVKKMKLTNVKSDEVAVSAQSGSYTVMVMCRELAVGQNSAVQVIVVSGPSGKQADLIREGLITAMTE